MTLVVGLATIVTEEVHGVVLGKVLRVVLHELLGAVPEGRDGLNVLVQAENEAVLLLLLVHNTERIVVDIAVKLDGGLNTPVVVVVEHQFLAEEKSRLESAHVAVADGITVDNLALGHVFTDLLGLLLINPLGERPVLLGDQTVVSLAGYERGSNLLESVIERLVVEENPVVTEAAIETIFDLTDGLGNLPNVAVASQSNKGGVHARTGVGAQESVPSWVVGSHGERKLSGAAGGLLLLNRMAIALEVIGDGLLGTRLLGASRLAVEDAVGESDSLIFRVGNKVKNKERLLEATGKLVLLNREQRRRQGSGGETYEDGNDDVAHVARITSGHHGRIIEKRVPPIKAMTLYRNKDRKKMQKEVSG